MQARRWTRTSDGGGYIYSFNGPHSLFADTMRSLRSLALAHRLGHALLEEGDRPVSLLERLWLHARTTGPLRGLQGPRARHLGRGAAASRTRACST